MQIMRRRNLVNGSATQPTVGGGSGDAHYFRPSTINVELPRGITSNNDTMFDESTGVISTRGGSSYDLLWQWRDLRHGSARHAAATVLTVTNTGSAGWTDFVAHVATFVAGSGDYEIRVPSALTMSSAWVAPTGAGLPSRQLYITFSGTLPTANVMPAENASRSVWTGPGSAQGGVGLVDIANALCPQVCLTGIRIKPQNVETFAGIRVQGASTASIADVPRKLVVDRCVIDGTDCGETRNGIIANGREIAMLETWVIDIRRSNECRGSLAYDGTKCYFLRNVYFESRSIGMLMGGADPQLPNTGTLDPQDILCINVACSRKSSWMTEDAGLPSGYLKNGFESKESYRWAMFNCVTYRTAATGQGHAMLFQPLQQNGASTNWVYCTVEDTLVYNHEFRDIQNGLTLLARVAYDGATLPVQPITRAAFVNVRMKNLGYDWGLGNGRGNPLQLLGSLNVCLFDKFTWLMHTNADDQIRLTVSVAGQAQRLTNFAGRNLGILATDSFSNGAGIAKLFDLFPGSTWDGHSMFGTPQYGGTHTPGLTQYSGNGSLALDAAAMGFNTTTGILSAPSTDDGTSGSVPGCDQAVLDAAISSMDSWAFSR